MTNNTEEDVKKDVIIDTIKGRKGKKVVYYPVDSTGKPLVPEKTPIIYDQKGEKQPISSVGEVVDIEA